MNEKEFQYFPYKINIKTSSTISDPTNIPNFTPKPINQTFESIYT